MSTGTEPAVTPRDLEAFTRQLGAMLDANVDVLRALRIASQHTGNEAVVRVANDLALRLKDGRELHQAASAHPELFDPFFIEMLRQGEADGSLGNALLSVADYLHHTQGTADTAPAAAPLHTVAAASAPEAPRTPKLLLAVAASIMGTAVVWAAAAAGSISGAWVGPIAMGWSGLCLLATAWGEYNRANEAQPAPHSPPSPKPILPPKTAERRAAETEGIVRSALQEQAEEEELRAASEARTAVGFQPNPFAEEPLNGKGPEHEPNPFLPEAEPPRFGS